MGELVIQNVNVVLPDQVLENGSVRLQDQLIQEVSENPGWGPRAPTAAFWTARALSCCQG